MCGKETGKKKEQLKFLKHNNEVRSQEHSLHAGVKVVHIYHLQCEEVQLLQLFLIVLQIFVNTHNTDKQQRH